ncbi:precorrin-6A synthase (deacetylating) [Pseudonocardia sp. GCM10023141]|uniref:precorrin-6A synthase (deacetylating) n=1 Tax=Pseudonocardia sp. GCM10023141 TaxID=3252653 RepID=UPI003609F1B2
MRTIYVIGIGAGDPEHLTLQAIGAMNRVDVWFTFDKGAATADLAGLRSDLLARHVTREHRVVAAPDPDRDRDPGGVPGYETAVADWLGTREGVMAGLLTTELPDGGTGGLLVWGDPALYDSTLRILDAVGAAVDIAVVSVPGITSIQALAAAHRIVLNRIGRPFLVTTGRRLVTDGIPAGIDDAVVLLDGRTAFAELPDADLDIFWGAYLGTADEVLVSGDLQERKAEICRIRADRRAAKGWIMDTYLLRRRLS